MGKIYFKKILLILPPNPAQSYSFVTTPFIPRPPLALLSLATYLRRKSPKIEISILDSQLLSLEEMLKEMKSYQPDLVGISPAFVAYNNTLILARLAKSLGARVILGGHYSVSMASIILRNRGTNSRDYCIDAICQQDGEEAIWRLVQGMSYEDIPNLIWLDGKNLRFNKVINFNLDRMPLPDWSLVNLNNYFERQISIEPLSLRTLPVLSRKGCWWRSVRGGCIFCYIADKGFRLKSPAKFWEELDFLQKQFKPIVVADIADDFLDRPRWFKEFHAASLKKLSDNLRFSIQTRADRINEESLSALKDIGIISIYMYLESANNRVLRHLRKGVSTEENWRACKLLSRAHINTYANFIFGGPGETLKTIESTLGFIRFLKKESPALIVRTRPFAITPGSPAWQMLIKKTGQKYLNQDNLNFDDLFSNWLRHFTKMTEKDILMATKETGKILTSV